MQTDRSAKAQNVRLAIHVGQPEVPLPGSPFAASIEKSEIDPSVTDDLETDFRGVIEVLLAREHRRFTMGECGLSHIALTADLGESVDQLSFDAALGVLTSAELEGRSPFGLLGNLKSEFYAHPAVSEFRQAYVELGLEDALETQQGHANQPRLISKIDLYRHLEQLSPADWTQPLVRLLDSYVDLLQFAEAEDDDWLRFWVRYPFSVSIWSTTDEGARIVGVAISPYHPLRLAWLASVESTLRNSESRWTSFLAGGIAGWQFPYFSVSRHAAGRLIAMPLDAGSEALFAGWSLLVPVQVDGVRGLEVPKRAGALRLPGVASDGLSANAVESATAKFFELHPFVSTVSVDLASRTVAPKSHAVDIGLVQAVSKWREHRRVRGLADGGVRIFDSVNREGDVHPSVGLLSTEDDLERAPFSWVRYEGVNPGYAVNIRVLGDSGLNYVAGNLNGGIRSGSVSVGLLRRFEVVGSGIQGNGALVEPSLLQAGDSTSLTDTFCRALALHEFIAGQSQPTSSSPVPGQPPRGMKFEVQAGAAVALGADWIIGGDSALPPTILSSMLRHAGGSSDSDLTIWDWHPPMFGSTATEVIGSIDLRPYVVVSSLTEAFKGRLDSLLVSCLQTDVDQRDRVSTLRSEVLETLGSRGVGISSLFANHKHKTPQRGALGFWSTLDLLSRVGHQDREILAIPLDKIVRLMEALSGRRSTDRRRADLLLIELSDDGIRMAPAEIKFMRLDNPGGELADPHGDEELLSALEQVGVSLDLCSDIVDELTSRLREDSASALLEWNAFMTLVDIGVRLSPTISLDTERRYRVAQWIRRYASSPSAAKVGLGNPLVVYLEAHNGKPRNFVGRPAGWGNTVLFQADPRDVVSDRHNSSPGQRSFDASIDLVFPRDSSTSGLLSLDLELSTGASPESDMDTDHLEFMPEVQEVPVPSDANTLGDSPSSSETEVLGPPDGVSEVAESLDNRLEEEAELRQDAAVPSLPQDDRGVRLLVGHSSIDGADVHFWPGNKSLGNPNVGIVGEMGSGKTQLCLSLVSLLRASAARSQQTPIGGLILDPKGDYGRSDRADFHSAAGAVVLPPEGLPIELIAIKSEDSRQDIALKISAFVDIFGRVLGRDFGALQRERLREAVKGVIEHRSRSPLIGEIYSAYKILAKDRRDTITSRLDEFVELGIFANKPEDMITIENLLSDRVVVVDLAGLFNHVSIQEQLMAIFVNQFQTALRAQSKHPIRVNSHGDELRTLNLFLLIDEASMVIRHDYKQLEDILRTGREFGVMTIMSSQFLSDFRSDSIDYGQSLRTWFVHQQSQVSRKELSDMGLPDSPDVVERLRTLPIHECLYSTHPGDPRFIRGRPWYEVAPELGA